MKIIINPKYKSLEGFIRQIPESFEYSGETIYKARNTIKIFDENGISICIKSFHAPSFFNRIIYSFFRLSKAERSYEYGLKLLSKGIRTPEPIAYIENKQSGLLYDSYYICINQPFAGMMRELRQGEIQGRESMLRSFAAFAASIHSKNVLHKDFSPGNILYEKSGEEYIFSIVDINRMSFCPVNMQTGCKNFKRLWGNNEMISFIADEYAKNRQFNPEKCKELTLKYHTKFWKKYTRRHNDFKPYEENS